jgi:hypothetical protein
MHNQATFLLSSVANSIEGRLRRLCPVLSFARSAATINKDVAKKPKFMLRCSTCPIIGRSGAAKVEIIHNQTKLQSRIILPGADAGGLEIGPPYRV